MDSTWLLPSSYEKEFSSSKSPLPLISTLFNSIKKKDNDLISKACIVLSCISMINFANTRQKIINIMKDQYTKPESLATCLIQFFFVFLYKIFFFLSILKLLFKWGTHDFLLVASKVLMNSLSNLSLFFFTREPTKEQNQKIFIKKTHKPIYILMIKDVNLHKKWK